MAQPINTRPRSRPLDTFAEEVHNAPAEHADAVLSAFDLLQLLHDRGILNLLRGMVGAGDELVGVASQALDTDDAIRAIRNFILLSKFFAGIHPDLLSVLAQNVREAAERQKPAKAPGILELLWRLRSENNRHAASVALDMLEAVGKGL